MKKLFLLLPVLSLIACEPELSPEQQAEEDQQAIDAVLAAQELPADPISPQPIRYPDIEKNNLYGASCAFAPEGGGLGAIALAMGDAGYMKIDGEIVRFAPDIGSAEIPNGGRIKYDGKKYSFRLELADGDGRQSGIETADYDATFTVRNGRDQIVYEASGLAQCGA